MTAIEAAKLVAKVELDNDQFERGVRGAQSQMRTMRTQFGSDMRGIGDDSDRMHRGLLSHFRSSESGFSGFGGSVRSAMSSAGSAISSMSSIAGNGFAIAAAAAVAAGASIMTSFAGLQDAFTPLGTAIGTNSDQFAVMRDAITQMVKSSPTSAAELGMAAYDIIGAGITDTTKALDALQFSQKLAFAGVSDVGSAADIMTSALNSFGASGLTAEKAAQIFFGTLQVGKGTLTDFSQGFGQIAPLASNVGISFTELMAATAALTTTGQSASESYTGLRALIGDVVKPTKIAQDALAGLGIEFSASRIKAVGLAGVMDDVRRATKGNADVMAQLFGSQQALNVVMALTGAQAGSFQSALTGVAEAGLVLDERAKQVTDTWSNRWTTAKNRTMATLGEIGFGVESLLKGDTAASTGFLASAFSLDDGQTAKLQSFLTEFGPGFRSAVASARAALGEIPGILASVIGRVAGFVSRLVSTFETVSTRLAPIAGPIADGLASGFRSAFDGIREYFSGVMGRLVEVAGPIIATLREFWAEHGEEIKLRLGEIHAVVGPIFASIGDIVGGFFTNVLKPVVLETLSALQFAWSQWGDDVMKVAGFFVEKGLPILVGFFETLGSVLAVFADLFQGRWGSMWENIKGLAQNALGFINSLTEMGTTALQNLIGLIAAKIRETLGQVANGLSSAAGEIRSFLAGLPGEFLGAIGNSGRMLYGAGRDVIMGLWNGMWDIWYNSVLPWVRNVMNSIPSAVRSVLGISSPSKVMVELGKQTMEGYRLGVQQYVPPSVAALQSVTSNSTSNVGGPMTVTVNMPQGSSGDDVVRALKEWQRANGAIPVRLGAV